jgi:hypothetical protein
LLEAIETDFTPPRSRRSARRRPVSGADFDVHHGREFWRVFRSAIDFGESADLVVAGRLVHVHHGLALAHRRLGHCHETVLKLGILCGDG